MKYGLDIPFINHKKKYNTWDHFITVDNFFVASKFYVYNHDLYEIVHATGSVYYKPTRQLILPMIENGPIKFNY